MNRIDLILVNLEILNNHSREIKIDPILQLQLQLNLNLIITITIREIKMMVLSTLNKEIIYIRNKSFWNQNTNNRTEM